MTIYFGQPWDAPAMDNAQKWPGVVVGLACLYCEEPIEPQDSGVVLPTVRTGADGKPTGDFEPAHRECFLRQVIGSVEHQEGRCGVCCGSGPAEGRREGLPEVEPLPSYRDQARAAVALWERR